MTHSIRTHWAKFTMWLADRKHFDHLKHAIDSREPAAFAIASKLTQCAKELCEQPIPAVTDKKMNANSPSRDPHDYVSIGTYWWPNPESSTGLPYIKRDGQLSPDAGLYDRPRWDRAADAIVQLIRAAYLLGDHSYADNAVRRLRRWFLDADTRMNPHLSHAQFIPGRHTGGAPGIIDFALYLPALLDHIKLLMSFSPTAWTPQDNDAMVTWCRQLTVWMTSHPLGIQERQSKNNHGTYYDRFLAVLHLFTGERSAVIDLIRNVPHRIAEQIAPDGSAPLELKRTCSFSYSLMNAQGFLDLACIATQLNEDLWTWSAPNGASIPAAINYLFRFAISNEAWPFEQIEPIDWRIVALTAQRANTIEPDRFPLAKLSHRLPAGFDPSTFAVLAPLHPFGAERTRSLIAPSH